MTAGARIAVFALGVACAALAVALWSDAGGGDHLSDGTILVGAVALALMIIGVVVTPSRSRRGAGMGKRR